MYLYSPETNAFYIDEISSDIPDGTIAVDESIYDEVTITGHFMPGRLGLPVIAERRPSELHTWDGADWIIDEPGLESLSEQLKQDAICTAEKTKEQLLSMVASKIAPLQDAVDLGMATPEEESALKEWKKYRVLVNRVDTHLGANVVWPEKP
ncbi:tail fiber assembly protein [Escherichia coli]|uniref:tail fiber assembly protein n=1 Tax=Escherichia coli TaxID=562 RepID=UPI0018C70C62|nr:tail fiber assembly protein [Escherichia coli]ELF8282504.1 tail fiber assembly protein [Escherichia coli]MBY8665712.1 tail fiber assembly protein [Escherichia coli]MBY8674532.1 tail fiber assembly protein [Escherichia coli]MBY8751779.1 tail fiber assembly protein [Escherichia coli]MCL7079706.1 tail fiber assembly protein [Escherichia coli]